MLVNIPFTHISNDKKQQINVLYISDVIHVQWELSKRALEHSYGNRLRM